MTPPAMQHIELDLPPAILLEHDATLTLTLDGQQLAHHMGLPEDHPAIAYTPTIDEYVRHSVMLAQNDVPCTLSSSDVDVDATGTQFTWALRYTCPEALAIDDLTLATSIYATSPVPTPLSLTVLQHTDYGSIETLTHTIFDGVEPRLVLPREVLALESPQELNADEEDDHEISFFAAAMMVTTTTAFLLMLTGARKTREQRQERRLERQERRMRRREERIARRERALKEKEQRAA